MRVSMCCMMEWGVPDGVCVGVTCLCRTDRLCLGATV